MPGPCCWPCRTVVDSGSGCAHNIGRTSPVVWMSITLQSDVRGWPPGLLPCNQHWLLNLAVRGDHDEKGLARPSAEETAPACSVTSARNCQTINNSEAPCEPSQRGASNSRSASEIQRTGCNHSSRRHCIRREGLSRRQTGDVAPHDRPTCLQ